MFNLSDADETKERVGMKCELYILSLFLRFSISFCSFLLESSLLLFVSTCCHRVNVDENLIQKQLHYYVYVPRDFEFLNTEASINNYRNYRFDLRVEFTRANIHLSET